MEEIDLKNIFDMFWNKKIHIIIILLIFIIIGSIYTFNFTKPIYSSSITLVLVSAGGNDENNETITTTDINVNSKLISTYSELIRSKNVLKEVISNLGIDIEEDDLRNNVNVTAVKNAELIQITVKNEQPQDATKIANELAKVFSVKVKEMYNINNIQLISEANEPTKPDNINHKKDIALFIFVGIGIAFIYVLALNMLDTTIKTAEEIEKEYDLPVLASIPVYTDQIKKINTGRKHG